MFDHEQLESSLAPWLLGALEPDESDAVVSHIGGCSSCRETATRLRVVTGSLALAADEVRPPDRLRERVLTAAAASRSVATPIPAGRRIRRPSAPRRGFAISLRGRIPVYAAAAAAVAALLVGLVAGELTGHGPGPSPAPSQVARFTLSGHQSLAGAHGTVIDLTSEGLALVDFSGLPALTAGRVYEVWLITPGGRADPAAVFVPDANGGKVVLVNRTLSGYSEMAVTNEAGPNGTQAPTQQPQLYGQLA